MKLQAGFTLAEIADHIGAQVVGDAARRVFSINTLENAAADQITFLSNAKYTGFLSDCSAGAVIINEELAPQCPVDALVCSNPYLGFALTAQLLDSTPMQAEGIAGTARIDPSADIHPSARIGDYCVIEQDAKVGANTMLGAGTYLGQGSSVGENSRLYPNTSVYHGVSIGDRAIIHSGTVIGSDGFGFAHDGTGWVKIPQLGGVVIGDDFECGANCTIDRGAIDDTVIGRDVKLDNMCHLAHNVQFGDHSAMAAYSGVAGSSKVGENCTVSGRVTILGHIEIADGVHITAGSQVAKSLSAGAYSSGSPLMTNRDWKRNVARLRQLDDMAKRIKQLEKQLSDLTSEKN